VKFHQCRAAVSGLMAALLAQQKFVATREFLTAPDGGLYNTYTNGGQREAVIADLNKRWELEQIALRPWPSASTIQGLITAMFDLVENNTIPPARVQKLRITVGKTAFDMHGIFPRYQGKFEALLSIHYAAAVILHEKQLTLAQFEPARYNDPALRRFAAEQVEVVCDTTLTGVQAVVEADLGGGQRYTARCNHPRGSPENRLTRAQVVEKFRTYARTRHAARADRIIDAVSNIEAVGSTRTLMDLLRTDDETLMKSAAA
jgi:2-methylcitrate dehydratase PrpD